MHTHQTRRIIISKQIIQTKRMTALSQQQDSYADAHRQADEKITRICNHHMVRYHTSVMLIAIKIRLLAQQLQATLELLQIMSDILYANNKCNRNPLCNENCQCCIDYTQLNVICNNEICVCRHISQFSCDNCQQVRTLSDNRHGVPPYHGVPPLPVGTPRHHACGCYSSWSCDTLRCCDDRWDFIRRVVWLLLFLYIFSQCQISLCVWLSVKTRRKLWLCLGDLSCKTS